MIRTSAGALLCLALTLPARGQEMEPKAYSASPVGVGFFVTAFSRSTGGVLADPTLPITDIHADVSGLAFGLGRTLDLFGKLGLVSFALPVASARVTGNVFEQARAVSRDGLGDTRVKLSINLHGNEAMTPREFARAPRRTIVGASVAIVVPAGQYDATKLINIGAHRWAFKPEIGLSKPAGHWDLDVYAGMLFFASNDDFFPGTARRTQAPMLAIQGHASYTIKRGLWVAADGTWYHGGSSRVDSGVASTALNNSRVGVTASLPIAGRYSVKAAFSSGMLVRTGSNFTTGTLAFQAVWVNRPRS